jgi:hypothetical protein
MYNYSINTKTAMGQRGSFPLPASATGGAKVLLQIPTSRDVPHVKKNDIL